MVDGGGEVIVPPQEVLEVQHQHGYRQGGRAKMGESKNEVGRGPNKAGRSIQICY